MSCHHHQTGEGLVERFVSILWSGTMPCLPRPSKYSSPSTSVRLEAVRPARFFLDWARLSCGGEFDDDEVDIVRDIVMTVPVFLTLIVFSAFTSQVALNQIEELFLVMVYCMYFRHVNVLINFISF